MSEAIHNAAGQLVDLVASKIGQGRAVHSETAISSASRLAGSLLFRSFHLQFDNLPPGTPLLSDQANERGPMLVSILANYLESAQVPFNSPTAENTQERGEPSKFDFVATLSMLQEDAIALARQNAISLEQSAQAAALATAFIVKECSANIGPRLAFNAAVFGIIEGCKTVPPRLTDEVKRAIKKRPWYRFW